MSAGESFRVLRLLTSINFFLDRPLSDVVHEVFKGRGIEEISFSFSSPLLSSYLISSIIEILNRIVSPRKCTSFSWSRERNAALLSVTRVSLSPHGKYGYNVAWCRCCYLFFPFYSPYHILAFLCPTVSPFQWNYINKRRTYIYLRNYQQKLVSCWVTHFRFLFIFQ